MVFKLIHFRPKNTVAKSNIVSNTTKNLKQLHQLNGETNEFNYLNKRGRNVDLPSMNEWRLEKKLKWNDITPSVS